MLISFFFSLVCGACFVLKRKIFKNANHFILFYFFGSIRMELKFLDRERFLIGEFDTLTH